MPSKMLATRCKMAGTKQELLKKSFPNPLTNPTKCGTIITEQRKENLTNQKGFTTMKKATMQSLISYLNGETITNLDEIKAELEAELNKGAAKAHANRDLYELAKEVVLANLDETPVTIGELYEAVEGELPEGFTKGKLQYAVTRMWTSEIVKIEGKVNTYRKA